jgi:hypothetical protein
MARTLDKLAAYEDWKAEILPKLAAMLKDGKSSKEIRKFAQAYLTARQVTIALTSDDEQAALKAIDAVTHQNEGKPKERVEHKHRYESLKDEELDALLASKLAETTDEDSKNH